MSDTSVSLPRARVIALVSGKGGSGKTLLAATMADILGTYSEKPVFLVDTDLMTGGMTYYLSVRTVERLSSGVCDMLAQEMKSNSQAQQVDAEFTSAPGKKFRFMPIGDHRNFVRLAEHNSSLDPALAEVLRRVIQQALTLSGEQDPIILMDCRGGMDNESLTVCRLSHDIILAAEPDATSIQASHHLVDILSDQGLANKLKGFILNKAFDDPTPLVEAGLFRCPYLGAAPFDVDAVRSYFKGELPSRSSIFHRQIGAILRLKLEELVPNSPRVAPLKESDFSRLTLADPLERLGAIVVGGVLLNFMIVIGLSMYNGSSSPADDRVMALCGLGLAVIGLVPPLRVALGRGVRAFVNVFGGRRRQVR